MEVRAMWIALQLFPLVRCTTTQGASPSLSLIQISIQPRTPIALALDSTSSETGDEGSLKDQEEDQHWQRDQRRVGHHHSPLRVLLEYVVHSNHYRADVFGLNDHIGPQERIPAPQKGENGYGRNNRAGVGQDDLPVDLEVAGSIDQCRFIQFDRNPLEELVKEENGKGTGNERYNLHLVRVKPALR